MASKAPQMPAETTEEKVQRRWADGGKRAVVPPHTGVHKLHLQAVKATLGSEEMRKAIELPTGIDVEEWVAAQMVTIFNNVEKLVCVLEEECTDATCPRMCAGKAVHYSWADEANPVARAMSAPKYCETLLTYADTKLSDRSLLPVDGSPVPRAFMDVAATLCKRFFRVYAHAFIHHYDLLQHIDAHVMFSYKHFFFVVRLFNLVEEKDMEPLKDMNSAILERANSVPECKEDEEEVDGAEAGNKQVKDAAAPSTSCKNES